MDSIFLVSARGSSSGSPEANQIIRGRHCDRLLFLYRGGGWGILAATIQGIKRLKFPQNSKEFLRFFIARIAHPVGIFQVFPTKCFRVCLFPKGAFLVCRNIKLRFICQPLPAVFQKEN